ncbi:DUF5348 domain-containing protein [Heliophilum fasciatum]|nr:DUF5348 domain-containing protein [Heliophilum fasciatum]
MSFDHEQDRWVVLIGKRNYGLHCGEYFHLHPFRAMSVRVGYAVVCCDL